VTKDFSFRLKSLKDDGTFEGLAAVYGNEDLGGDIIEPGAFTKTIKDKNGVVPILWQHDSREPIGRGDLKDTKEGLAITGKLVLESDVATKAYALMKADVLQGLSIGYDTVVSEYDRENDIRRLKELKLWEVSVVTFPMNPKATISAVKAAEMADTLDEVTRAIAGFARDTKAGRTLSAATIEKLRSVHAAMQSGLSDLSALLATSDDEAGKAAAKSDIAPVFHASVSVTNLLSKGLGTHGS
jgi:HK97 family phage prohead protease